MSCDWLAACSAGDFPRTRHNHATAPIVAVFYNTPYDSCIFSPAAGKMHVPEDTFEVEGKSARAASRLFIETCRYRRLPVAGLSSKSRAIHASHAAVSNCWLVLTRQLVFNMLLESSINITSSWPLRRPCALACRATGQFEQNMNRNAVLISQDNTAHAPALTSSAGVTLCC